MKGFEGLVKEIVIQSGSIPLYVTFVLKIAERTGYVLYGILTYQLITTMTQIYTTLYKCLLSATSSLLAYKQSIIGTSYILLIS